MRRRTFLGLLAAGAGLTRIAPAADTALLVAEMTLEEKLGQLAMLSADYAVTGPTVAGDVSGELRAGRVGSLFNLWGREAIRAAQRIAVEETRLGIPLFFALDILHGFRTIFPIPLAEAAAFDPALWEETARAAAVEAIAAGVDLTFAPMLDVARDPRWGRIAEGPGEDPCVADRFATAKVRGYQGSGLAATPKHFAAYGASAAGRDYAAVDISERALAEIYLPPFRAAIDAGALALMPAFTDLAGVPLTANRALLTDTLRTDWGFDGVVISDYNAIAELTRHGVAADTAEAAALALRAGVDIDMMSRAYRDGLPVALDRGLVTLAEIDTAVARVLALKARLGLFADPFRRAGPVEPAPPPRALARAAAARGLTLLTNRGDTLPIETPPARLALIGPLADAPADMLGPWAGAGRPDEAVALLPALRDVWPDARIDHVPAVPIAGGEPARIEAGLAAAVAAATRADHVLLCLGEAASMSGEAASRAHLSLPGQQQALADAVLATGKPVVLLLFSGRPLILPDLFDRAAATVACWFPGSEAGPGIADLLTGRVAPSARLPVTWPRAEGQIPIAYAARPGGRPENRNDHYTSKYIDLPNSPQFAFGHGLSTTSFTMTDPAAEGTGPITARTTVANAGRRAGTATVFLFLHDPVSIISRPTLELRRFTQVTLAPGERREVAFTLARDDFAALDAALRPAVEPGAFDLHLGFSADPAALRTIRVTVA